MGRVARFERRQSKWTNPLMPEGPLPFQVSCSHAFFVSLPLTRADADADAQRRIEPLTLELFHARKKQIKQFNVSSST